MATIPKPEPAPNVTPLPGRTALRPNETPKIPHMTETAAKALPNMTNVELRPSVIATCSRNMTPNPDKIHPMVINARAKISSIHVPKPELAPEHVNC
ncbi:unnamed protein product [Rotaria sp. Silwood1]|nr:unnamed protein product [Rotaria sp. Silwood1]